MNSMKNRNKGFVVVGIILGAFFAIYYSGSLLAASSQYSPKPNIDMGTAQE